MASRRLAGLLTLSVVAMLAAPQSGCNIVGPLFFLAHGPEKVKKRYELDKEKSLVLFLDDRGNKVPRRALRVTLATEFEKTVLRQELVKDVISAQSAMLAAAQDKQGKPIPITEIGTAVKADTVVYATVDGFTLSTDGSSFSPVMVLRVKVVDVATGKRLWPEEASGYPLQVRTRVQAGTAPESTNARFAAEEALAKQAGLEIAQLFYNHDKPVGIKSPT